MINLTQSISWAVMKLNRMVIEYTLLSVMRANFRDGVRRGGKCATEREITRVYGGGEEED